MLLFIVIWLRETFVDLPFERFYKHTIWSSMPTADICSSLTGVDAYFWSLSAENQEECALRIHRHMQGLQTAVQMVVYVWAAYYFISTVSYYLCVVRPILKSLRRDRMLLSRAARPEYDQEDNRKNSLGGNKHKDGSDFQKPHTRGGGGIA
jgi:hypothetical protein